MHVITDNDNKVTVRIVTATRDAKTGRLSYSTFDSFDVGGATPEQVFAAAKEGVLRAGTKPTTTK